MGSKQSRTPRYSKQVHESLVRHLRAGAYKSHAARAAGISVDALDQWIKLGRAGDRKYAALARDVDRVMAEDAIRKQAVITAAAFRKIDGDWKAAAWELERKYPKLYGRPNMSAAVGVTVGSGEVDDDGNTNRPTRIEFYLPDNGRRPPNLADDDEEDEEA